MFCVKCGNKNADKAKFCGKCGNRIADFIDAADLQKIVEHGNPEEMWNCCFRSYLLVGFMV